MFRTVNHLRVGQWGLKNLENYFVEIILDVRTWELNSKPRPLPKSLNPVLAQMVKKAGC